MPPPPPLRDRVTPRAPWLDPNLANAMESDGSERLTPGAPTNAPDRLTIWVPTETTYLSLGEQAGTLHERGIHGHTDHHIHFFTTKTSVLMGEGCGMFGGHAGYTMVTSENAYHHADLQHVFHSRDQDVLVRTASDKTAVLQSDTGATEVAANRNVTFTGGEKIFITAGSFTPVTTTYDVDWARVSHEKGLSSHLSKVVKVASMFQSAGKLVAGLLGSFLKCVEGEASWIGGGSMALAKAAVSTAKLVVAASGFGTTPKSIAVSGDVGVGLTGLNVALFGPMSASVASLGGASLISGTVEFKGWGLGGVWSGLDATLTSNNEVGVASPFGKVSFDASSTASFVSDGSVRIWGQEKVSLRSGQSVVAAYGANQAYVGAGGGYGLLVDAKKVGIGKMTAAKDFAAPGLDSEHAIVVSNENVVGRFGKTAKVHANGRDTRVDLQVDKKHYVRVSSEGVRVQGTEIFLD